LNPVYVSRQKNRPLRERIAYLRNYQWSSYRGYIGLEKPRKYVTYGPILAETGARGRQQRKEYRKYVECGIGETDAEFEEILKGSQIAIGGDEFRAWARDACLELAGKAARPEDVALRKTLPHLEREKVVQVVARHLGVETGALRERRRNSILRPIAARMLMKYSNMSHRDVAGVLGMGSGVAASQQARRAALLKEKDSKSRKLIESIEEALDAEIPQDRPA
ncbi:MAG: hypothetical protein JXN60_01530, partial [Lentisphaerae bacterium]|nr:hypothetical protein [Lentisphaerota bacterium]